MNQSLQPATTYGAVMGSVLARQRKQQLNLDQTDVAKELGITQASWSRIENGATPLTIDMLARAAPVLQMTPAIVLEQTDRAVRHLNRQGIRVEHGSSKDALRDGIALIAAVALLALVMAALKSK